MNHSNIFDHIKEILRSYSVEGSITLGSSLAQDFYFDYYDMECILDLLEDAFEVNIPDLDKTIYTVEDLVGVVSDCISKY